MSKSTKKFSTEKIVIAAMNDCTDPPYCVLVGRDGNVIQITSSVPGHDGRIDVSIEQFEQASRVISAADPYEIDPFAGTDAVLSLITEGTGGDQCTFLVGPDGNRIRFYHHELSSWYKEVRDGFYAEHMQLDTVSV